LRAAVGITTLGGEGTRALMAGEDLVHVVDAGGAAAAGGLDISSMSLMRVEQQSRVGWRSCPCHQCGWSGAEARGYATAVGSEAEVEAWSGLCTRGWVRISSTIHYIFLHLYPTHIPHRRSLSIYISIMYNGSL
jgi:hypothetical protein